MKGGTFVMNSLGRLLALFICIVHLSACSVKIKKPKFASARDPASTTTENESASISDSSSSNTNDDATITAQAPVLSYDGATGTTGVVNQPMSILPTTLNDRGHSITECAIKTPSTALPAWANVNGTTCEISGTPTTPLTATTYTLSVKNSDGTADATVSLTVNAGVPTLSYLSATGTTGTAGQAISVSPITLNTNGASITACGILSGSTNAGSFPGTLSVNASTCVISGTPTVPFASTDFTLVATNSVGNSSNAVVALNVQAGTPNLSYSGASGTTGAINQAMVVSPTTLTHYGASVTACQIQASTTALPGWASVNASTCVISGTPTNTLSSTPYTLIATNSVGNSSPAVVTLTVGAGVPSLSYSGASGSTGSVNQALSVSPTTLNNNSASITACGIKSGSTNAGSFPGTLSVNASTCVISGTPTAPLASTAFTLVATNSTGNSTDATVTLAIDAAVPTLSYSGSTGTTGTAGQAMSITPTTLTPNGAAITACGIKAGSTNAGSFPGTLSVNASTCVISGTPTTALSSTPFTLVATNSMGNSSNAVVTLAIAAGVPDFSYAGSSATTGAVNQAMSVTPTSLHSNGASVTACGIKSGSTNAGSFPGTLSVNASTCVISGTPTALLSATSFTLVASNSAGSSTDTAVTLTVGVGGVPSLSYSGATGTTGTVNQALSVSPTNLVNNGASITACDIKASTTALPAWASVNASTCVISGTPTTTLASTTYTLIASSSAGNSTDATVSLIVNAGVPSFSYSGASGTTGTVNQAMSVTPPTLNANGASVTACGIKAGSTNAGSFPGTLSVNASTCVISGTPTATLSSTDFTLVATNSAGDSSNAIVTLTIGAGAPSLSYSGATGTTGTVNQAISVTPTTLNANGASVTACGIKAGSTNAGSFPGTLSINASTCVISGTPAATLSATAFTLVATNSAGDSSNAAVTLTIGAGVPSLSYSGATGTTGAVNSALSVSPTTLNANGASITVCGIKSGSTNEGSFPGTLSVNASTCVISGTPTGTLSSTDFTLVATNSAGDSSNAIVTLTIGAGVPGLSYSGATGTTGTVNQAMSITPTTLNTNGASITACDVRVPTTALPGWASVNASTCVISGTPTGTLSSTPYTLIATNSAGNSSDATISLTVNAGVPSLSYAGATGTTGAVNSALSVTPPTLTPNGASITACGIKGGSTNEGSFPGTLSVDASTCVISGTPTTSLSATAFTLIATNSAGNSSDAAVTLTINAIAPSLSYSGATGTTGTVGTALSVSPTTLTNNGASVTACGIKSGSTNEGSFPGTLSVDASTCVISGTPTATLSATAFTLVATNSIGTSSNAAVTLTINAGAPILSYSGATGTTGTVGTALSVSPTTLTNNGASVTACGIKSGSTNSLNFPGTLTVNAGTCVISGTPTAVLGTTSFTLVATNSVGVSSDATVSLTINAGIPILSYSGATGTSIKASTALSVSPTTLTNNGASITACEIKAGSTNAASFPGTLSINASTCVISGTPVSTLAATAFTLVATNSAGTSADAAVTLTILTSNIAQQAYLKAPNVGSGDHFGSVDIYGGQGVAISGDTLLVGAHLEDSNQSTITNGTTASADNSAGDSGAAYVFIRSGSTWSQQAYLKAPNVRTGYQFGYSAAISGDTAIIGSHGEASNVSTVTNGTTASTNNSLASGGAYIFVRSGTTWTQQAFLKAPNPHAQDSFGYTVDISGDTAVVGALYEDSNQSTITNGATASANASLTNPGSAYVFVRSGTTWSHQAYLKAPNVDSNDIFGIRVAVSGDTVIVGARESSNQSTITNGSTASANNSLTNAGAVYAFVRSGTTWTQQAYIKAPNAGSGDFFGECLGISGDTFVAGARFEDSNQSTITNGATASADNSSADSGAAYVFVRSGTTWTHQAYLKAPNVGAGDQFGAAVAISGDTITVGAPYEDSNQSTVTNSATASADNSSTDSGAAYVFTRSGTTWTQKAYLKAPNVGSSDDFGHIVAVSGDTVIVGASLEDSSQSTITNGSTASADNSASDSGAVYVFY